MEKNKIVEKDMKYIADNAKEEFNKMSGKNLLITGGAGFLGHYLINSVLHWNDTNKNKKPIKIWVYDNFSRGIPEWITELKKREDIKIIDKDITKPITQTEANFHYIIHAASIASPHYYRIYPLETMHANVDGLRHLLEYAVRQKNNNKPIEGFLFFSSSEIYGDPTHDNIPTPETYRGNVSCIGPRACYDESKRYGETLCINFAKQHRLPVKIARPFNNYGPGLNINDKRVIPDFARNILSGEDIVMLSDGSPTRTFCYVSDAVVGYYKILIKGRHGESYNIGVMEPEISMLDLAKRLVDIGKRHFGYTGEIIYKDSKDEEYLTDSPNRRCPDISKAIEHIGYCPSVDIDEGLLRTMYWYSENFTKKAKK
ncbi:MAG: NAD-dependent epimerase/dehydratase family protein [Candidatus Aenigmarchaeota archaeon]|nr:NAD-dependent epimerase/dehydratase family protein [Candidatus Aenigmarchaeota archaeon]